MLNRFTQIMFNTFAVVEPSWNNPPNPKKKIPKGPAMYIYSLLTFKDLLNDLQTAKASPDLVAALNQKVSGGIHVPRDFATLKEAVGFFERYAGSDSVSFSMIKDGADAEHKANKDPDIVTIPRKIVVGKGEHQIPRTIYLTIRSAMHIVGDPGVPKEEIVVVGGIKFEKEIQGNCHLQHLTIRQAKHLGVEGQSSFTMEDVLVEQCGWSGVKAWGTGVVGRCTNVEVRQCRMSGVYAADGASITLTGAKTKVHHNCTTENSYSYGLAVWGPSSTIQLVFPLTKEQVSLDNGGSGNWGAVTGGDISQIKTITKAEFTAVLEQEARIEAVVQKMKVTNYALVNVPLDCDVNDAVKAVNVANARKYFTDGRSITIVLGKGEHQIDGEYLEIFSAMHIVGDSGVAKEEVVVVGGIWFKKGIPGNCHLQHLTVRQAKGDGVLGRSSFTMEDVLVEQCGWGGVYANGTGGVGRCTNVEVRQCGRSGVDAFNGASITLIGAKTTVHHNCTKGDSGSYGLKVSGSSSSTIRLCLPLTKETVSTDNGGGGNWGAWDGGDINEIKEISCFHFPTLANTYRLR